MGHREGQLASADGTRLHWQAWLAEEPVGSLLVVHGLGEHGGRYCRLAEAMSPRGWSCWALDLRGMGSSDGQRGHVDSWDQWIQDVVAFQAVVEAESGPHPIVPLGHSFGGVLVLTAVERGAIRPDRFVLSNPALRARVRVPGWKRRLGSVAARTWPTLAMANEVDPALISRDPAEVDAYRRDPLVHDRISARLYAEWTAAGADALERAGRLDVPFLLILAGDDRIIDAGASKELAARTGSLATIRTYPDRFHEPFNDLGASEVFDDLAQWLTPA